MVRKNKRNFSYFLLAISFLLLAISVFFILIPLRPIDVKEFEATFTVDPNVSAGFDVNTESLTFGMIGRGSSSKRTVSIINEYTFPIKIEVRVSDNLAEFLDSEREYIVEPGNNVSIPLNLRVPSDYPFGDYAGKVRFEIYKL